MGRLSYSFRGIIAPVFTPFDERTMNLNLSIIPQYAKYLSDCGIKGVLVSGTTGEGTSMSVSERKQIAAAWVHAVKTTRQHLMIQVGGAPLPDVIQLAKHAEEIKAHAILCLPELYFKPTEPSQLINYLKIIGDAAPNTPLLYYHIPMFTNVKIHMGQFLETIDDAIPSFVGIKFTDVDLSEGAQAARADSGRFAIFLGNDHLISAAHAVGMDSFIATSVNIFPDVILQILDAQKKNDGARAAKLQETLSKAVVAISKYGNWVVTMKTAMRILNSINPGPVRAPLENLSPSSVEAMKKDLKALDLIKMN